MAMGVSIPSDPARFGAAAGLRLRPAAERFHSRLDWLDSWHSFSFAGHDDPAWRGFGSLRVINEDRISAGRGFGLHPHAEMEIITVMLAGVLVHQDSLGHRQPLAAGEVQCMSAGRGIVHSEMNGGEETARLLQIWIEPERRGGDPGYAQKPFPIQPGWTLLIDPDRRDGALPIGRAVRLWRGRADAGERLSLPGPMAPQTWLQQIDGAISLELRQGEAEPVALRLESGDGLGIPSLASATLQAGASGADLLLFSLDPGRS
jgi:redox-sensitive bicupin YhaK (pirin superfamily)